MTDRTYKYPGPCDKCGAHDAYRQWKRDLEWDDGTATGHLEAVCRFCGYSWKVRAKDE